MTPPQRSNFHPQYRPDIDGLRALAILPVLAFHAFPSLAPGGFAGVDIFFVISGYLIGLIILRSLQRGSFRFAEFYAHRVRRIFPALAAVLAASLLAGWFVLLPQEYRLLGKHVLTSAAFLQNFALQREAGYFDVASDGKPLLHLWSLAVEEHFYLLFPLLAWALWRLGRSAMWLGLLLAATGSLLWGALGGIDATAAFYWPHLRAWELLAGALLAHWQITRETTRQTAHTSSPGAHAGQHLAAWLGLTAIAGSVLGLDSSTRWPGWAALLPVSGAALLIAAGSQAWPNRRLLAWRPLVWVGLISYPLYLWHWPLLVLLRIVEGGQPPLLLRLAAVALSVLLAALTWRYIERPLRRRPGPRVVAGLCVLLALLAGLGWAVKRHAGLPQRLPPDMAAALAVLDAPDRPWLPGQQQADCQAQLQGLLPQSVASLMFCRRVPGTERYNTVLLGDSHAVSLYPGLVQALAGSPWQAEHMGFALAAPLWGLVAGGPDPATDEWIGIRRAGNEAIRRHVLATPGLHTVILDARWPAYLHGVGFGEADAQVRGSVYSDLPGVPADNALLFEAALRNTLGQLSAAGRQVVFVFDAPELGFAAPSCLPARPWSWRAQAARTPCAIARQDYEARSQAYRALVNRVLADFPQVLPVDGAPAFCDDQWCWGMQGGELLYYDSNHITRAGALRLGQRIRQALERQQTQPQAQAR